MITPATALEELEAFFGKGKAGGVGFALVTDAGQSGSSSSSSSQGCWKLAGGEWPLTSFVVASRAARKFVLGVVRLDSPATIGTSHPQPGQATGTQTLTSCCSPPAPSLAPFRTGYARRPRQVRHPAQPQAHPHPSRLAPAPTSPPPPPSCVSYPLAPPV